MKVVIEAKREVYSLEQLGSSMTVRELIAELSEYDGDLEVAVSSDGGYSFGALGRWDISEQND